MAATDVALAVKLIGSLLIEEVSSLYGVEEQVQGLQEELEIMQQYLQDADARQQDREVCALVSQVRKLAYDAEDVIDTYIFKVRLKSGNRLMRFSNFMYKYAQIYQVQQQIQVLQTSLKRISDKLNSHGVRRITNLKRGICSREDVYGRQKPQSYPYDDSDGAFFVGMEDDIRKVVDVVMSEGRTLVGVVSIVGMGGCGKTTLARKLYNHPYAIECFDCSAWVCISQEWSTHHILSEILRKVGGPQKTMTKVQSTLSVEELVDKLRRSLQKKSYLVVLDDVWSREVLEEILPALPLGGSLNNRSKIIITTRNREIISFRASHQEHLYIHEPKPMTKESSWQLFNKIALSHRKNYDEKSFRSLGEEMLLKCDGLPLAVVALAGILSTRETIGEWHQVAEAVKSRILEGRCIDMYGRVGKLLALSYDDLPFDLKPCFLHLGVFPEDSHIPVGMLTRMWIAEGLVSTEYSDTSLEDVALQRIEELSHRFMIQVVRTNSKGTIKAIRIHDILRDLSVQKAKEQSFLQIYTPFSNSHTSHLSTLTIQPRRAAVHSSAALPVHISNLRSLVLTQATISSSCYSSEETLDLQCVSKNFKLLRVLSIWGIKIVSGTLPVGIGCLIHLRYLAIRATNVTVLPSSIGGLRNLLTLDYRDIDMGNNIQKEKVRIEIPTVFDRLVLLRHLFLPIECPWSVQELKLNSLSNLRTLWGVRLDNNSSCLLREVPKLSITLKKLKIVVSSESELGSAFGCPSLMADVLHTFECDLRDGVVLRNVEPLRPLKHLLKLTFIGEIQMNLSVILPVNLTRLGLRDSKIEDSALMEALGALVHLKRLSLSNAYVGTTLSCSPSSFPQLEELNVESLPLLHKWTINKGAMPCLKNLEITRCWRLKEFPLGLNFVTTLEKLEFFDMPSAFCSQAAAYGWAPQKHRLPHNFGSIIEHFDSPVDSFSIRTLYEQLSVGIFLDNKTKKYWVTKKHGTYNNSFMIYASCLRISSRKFWDIGTQTFQKKYNDMKECPFVECKEVIESQVDGAMITVAKLKPSMSPAYFEVVGKCDLGVLSLNVQYEIAWVIMFAPPEDSEYSSEGSLHSSRSSKPWKKERQRLWRRQRDEEQTERKIITQGRLYKKKEKRVFVDEMDFETRIYTNLCGEFVHEEVIDIEQPNDEWIRIPGGVITTDVTSKGEIMVSMSYAEGIHPLGLVIKGFIIQPKS